MTTPFEARQQTYYTREINRGLPSQGGPAPGDVAAAVSTDNAGLGAAAASFLADFGSSTQAVRAADAACRTLAFPDPSMRDPGARTGCGWWYTSDPTRQSIGALGTRRGPMNPTMDTTYGAGQWLWDPAEAAGYEALKRAGQVQSCPDLVNSGTSRYAWCPSTNMAVPIDPNSGNLLYPTQPRGDCPGGNLVLASAGVAACSNPTNSAANYTPPSAGSGCTDGSLTSACLTQAFTGLGNPEPPAGLCTTGGIIGLTLQSGGTLAGNPAFTTAFSALPPNQFTLNAQTYASGQTTMATVIADSQGLARFARTGPPSRAQSAANALCYGGQFNPCSYTTADTGPFDLSCIRQIAMGQYGYTANAGLLTLGDAYWNNATTFPNWGKVIEILIWWKTVADNAPGPNNLANPLTSTSSDDIQNAYDLQRGALNNVYGINLPAVNLTCSSS
jgi:hypothetical protein